MKTVRVAVCVLLVMLCAGCSGERPLAPSDEASAELVLATGYANPGAKVIPPDALPHGKSFAQWSTLAWQWMAAAPLDHSPGLDETGADMAYGQSGPVWFLLANFTGGTTTRTGVVPTGTMLFLTLMAFETSSREGYGETEAELLAAAAGVVDMVTDMACEVDGVPVQGLDRYRFPSPELFSLTVPEDNVFDLWGVETPAGTYYPSAADGYYLMLAPLSAGQHTIHWRGAIDAFGYYPDITYNITVTGGPRDRQAGVLP